jgi:ATP-dependent DNA ligase
MPASCAVLDGELVAFDVHGKPDFPLVCECVLHRHASIPLTFIAFDVLSVDGHSVVRASSLKRRRILEEMQLEGSWPPRLSKSIESRFRGLLRRDSRRREADLAQAVDVSRSS